MRLAAFCHLDQLGERGAIGHRQVGQHFAIERHSGVLEAGNESAIRQAVGPRARVDARDPQLAELALALAAVTVSIVERVQQTFARFFPEPVAAATLALHHSQDFVVAAAQDRAALCSRHGLLILQIGRESFHALLNALPGHLDHLAELGLDARRLAAAQVALTLLGAPQLALARQPEALGR